MKKVFLFLAIASTSIFVSCDDDETTPPAPVATSIVLTTDVTTIDLGASVTLTVTNDLGADVTSTSSLFVNDIAISGPTFTPPVAGTYELHATNGTLPISNTVTVIVNAVPAMNSIFFNELNNSVNNSACVFWGGYDLDDDGEVDHAYWSMLAFVGNDIASADPTVSDQYIDVEFLTPLNATGGIDLPTTTNVVYLDIYELHLNGTEVTITSEGDTGELNLSENLTLELTETAFDASTVLNGNSPLELNYDGSFLGIYDGSGGKLANGVKATKVISKTQLAKSKAKFYATLKK